MRRHERELFIELHDMIAGALEIFGDHKSALPSAALWKMYAPLLLERVREILPRERPTPSPRTPQGRSLDASTADRARDTVSTLTRPGWR
jgi:hypothetical protein